MDQKIVGAGTIYQSAYEGSFAITVHLVLMSIKKESVKKEVHANPAVTATSKKSSGKEKRQLVRASGEYCFWTNDGSVVSNLSELAEVLGGMDNGVFAHHVTKDRNDFADWIEGVLLDAELAKSFRSAKKPADAQAIVERRLKLYNV